LAFLSIESVIAEKLSSSKTLFARLFLVWEVTVFKRSFESKHFCLRIFVANCKKIQAKNNDKVIEIVAENRNKGY